MYITYVLKCVIIPSKKAQQPGDKTGGCNILYGPVCLRSSLQNMCLYTQTHTHNEYLIP